MHLQIKRDQIWFGSVSGWARFQKTLFRRVGSGPSEPLHLLNRPKTNRMHPQIVPTRVGSDRVGSNPGWIRLGSGPFSKNIAKPKSCLMILPGRIGPTRVGCTPKSTENGSDAPPNRPNTGRLHPQVDPDTAGSDQVGPNSGRIRPWTGPFSNFTAKHE